MYRVCEPLTFFPYAPQLEWFSGFITCILLISGLIYFSRIIIVSGERYKPFARKIGFEAKNVVAFVAIDESLISLAACYSNFSQF